jgi:hypothetical protein
MAQKFICDGMLGKLCKLLRTSGIDTTYSNEGIDILLKARKDKRIILTKNTHLRNKNNVFFIEASQSLNQLKDVFDKFDLTNSIQPFSRCIVCNEELTQIDKNSARDKIPYYTYKKFDEFAICPNCQRVYWKGSHYKNMVAKIKKALEIEIKR